MDGGGLLRRLLGSLEPGGGVPLGLLGPPIAYLLGGGRPGRGSWASPHGLCLGDDKFQGVAVGRGHPEQARWGKELTVRPPAGRQGLQGLGAASCPRAAFCGLGYPGWNQGAQHIRPQTHVALLSRSGAPPRPCSLGFCLQNAQAVPSALITGTPTMWVGIPSPLIGLARQSNPAGFNSLQPPASPGEGSGD